MQLLAFQNTGLSRKWTHYGSLEKAFWLFQEELLGLRDECQQNKDCTAPRLDDLEREKSRDSSRTLDSQT